MSLETEPVRKSLAPSQGSISYLEWKGAGPTIHFAHANGFNAQTYRSLLSPLSDQLHILVSDARGHGFSDLPTKAALAKGWTILRDDLMAMLDALHPEPIILAGHSLGAVVSLMVAAARPELVRGLVLVEPVLVPENYTERNNPGPSLAVMTRQRRDRFASFEDALKSYRGRGAFASWPENVLRDYLEGGLLPTGDGVRLACPPLWEAEIYAGNPVGAAKLVRAVTCPVTVLYGDTKSTAPDSEVQIIAQNPNARILKVPGASHFLPMEKPDVVRAEILRMAEAI